MSISRTFTAAVLAALLMLAPLQVASSTTGGAPDSQTTESSGKENLVTESAVRSQPVVIGGTEEQQETAYWALGRFQDAGLVVPPIEIHLHDVQTGCKGHRGIFNAGLLRIDVCVDEPTVMLHEIAHAWNWVNLDDQRRSAYVIHGEFGSWDDPDTPWHDRGSEDAADTIAWALLEDPIAGFTADGPIARTCARYEMLTGREAPRIAS